MARALWNGQLIAEDQHTVMVEGNHYFSPSSIVNEALLQSEHTSYCAWKGTAQYFHVLANGRRLENAAWTYQAPAKDALHIKDRIAFWKGVEVQD